MLCNSNTTHIIHTTRLTESNGSFLRTSSRNTFLDFFLAQDLDGVFGEDVAKTGPDGGCCDEVSVIISIEQKQ